MYEEPAIVHLVATGTPFVWDKYLPAGRIAQDGDGLWHMGEGTDPHILLFEVSLTKFDRGFFKELHITT